MVTDASSLHLMQEFARLKGVTVGRLETATRRGLSDRVLKPLHPSNSAGDGSLQRVRRVSVDRATVSPAREKCRPHPHMDRPPVSRVKSMRAPWTGPFWPDHPSQLRCG